MVDWTKPSDMFRTEWRVGREGLGHVGRGRCPWLAAFLLFSSSPVLSVQALTISNAFFQITRNFSHNSVYWKAQSAKAHDMMDYVSDHCVIDRWVHSQGGHDVFAEGLFNFCSSNSSAKSHSKLCSEEIILALSVGPQRVFMSSLSPFLMVLQVSAFIVLTVVLFEKYP